MLYALSIVAHFKNKWTINIWLTCQWIIEFVTELKRFHKLLQKYNIYLASRPGHRQPDRNTTKLPVPKLCVNSKQNTLGKFTFIYLQSMEVQQLFRVPFEKNNGKLMKKNSILLDGFTLWWCFLFMCCFYNFIVVL